MFDPISFAVTLFAIYAMLTRSPGLAGEAVREWQLARRGEESDAAKARRARLAAAGIDPVTDGGAFRQYAGNAWREYWLDKDADRKHARARRMAEEADAEARSWWQRMQDRADDEIDRRTAAWRTAPQGDASSAGPDRPDTDGTARPDSAADTADASRPEPDGKPATSDPDPEEDEAPGVVHEDDDTYTNRRTGTPTDDTDPEPRREPIRVHATRGDPIKDPTPRTEPIAAITAGGTMTIVAQQEVTGVVSGAAEARAIQRQIEAATAEYVAQLARVRARIHALGEQTLGTVQMATYSQVVALTATAAESAAAAQHAAKSCSAEVAPLMGSVARAFDRINS